MGKTLKKLVCFVLAFIMVCSLMPVNAMAQVIECSYCGHHTLFFWEVDESEYFCDCGVSYKHENCWEATHCIECEQCKDSVDWYCETCHKCADCFDEVHHCAHCRQHTYSDICGFCQEAGMAICLNCLHPDDRNCEVCGRCGLSIVNSGDMFCEGFYANSMHCVTCDEAWICSDCGQCCLDFKEGFCTNCDMCLLCAERNGDHCEICAGCFKSGEVTECQDNEDYVCVVCCTEAGNHCTACGNHVDEWCVGGEGTVCLACHENDLCESCGACPWCEDVEFCDVCGLCMECCLENSEDAGCECGMCVQNAEFEEESHMCPQCGSRFSCAGEEFCEDCGFCMDCCLTNSEEAECCCGTCTESSDWEDPDHLCENCGKPACSRGEICPDCGYCLECCVNNSEAEGCCCGTCTESTDWEDPEHLCEGCGQVFFCSDPMCDWCQLCLECCEDNAEMLGCEHGWCVEDPSFQDHYCENCGKCKEDCSCGNDCCSVEENCCGCCSSCTGASHCDCGCENCICGAESLMGIGSILAQPSDVRRRISGSSEYSKAGNRAVFRVRAYAGNQKLQYQWYCRKDSGSWTPLEDEEYYNRDYDETLSLISGANGNVLRVYVPEDACAHSYSYYCEISGEDGEVLSESRVASLTGKHVYEWCYNEEDVAHPKDSLYHYYRCIGCGYVNRDLKEEHVPGSWHFVRFATREQGAILDRRCSICGLVYDTQETEPLEEDHQNHHSYYYIALEYQHTLPKTERVVYRSVEHLLQCRCGLIGGREEHTWSDWVITKSATESEEGAKWRQCLYCNFRQVETISKSYHEHWQYQGGAEYDPEYYRDRSSHWLVCNDPECDTVMYKHDHEWVLDGDAHYSKEAGHYPLLGNPGEENRGYNLEVSDKYVMVQLRCKTCGYTYSYSTNAVATGSTGSNSTRERIGAGMFAIVAENTANPVRWTTAYNSSGDPTRITLTAKPPQGYRFVKWVNHSEECYPIKISDPYSSRISFNMVSDRTVEKHPGRFAGSAESPYDYFPTNVLYLEAVCERIPNRISLSKANLYSPVFLNPGECLLDDWTVLHPGERLPEGRSVIAEYCDFDTASVDPLVKNNEYYAYNRYADCPLYQANLDLYDYNGGSISLTSTGAPCTLNITTYGSNSISTHSYTGICGCVDGGEVVINGCVENGKRGSLRILVDQPSTDMAAGIQTEGQYLHAPNSVRIQDSAEVSIRMINKGVFQFSGGSTQTKAYGIYSRGFVYVRDDSTLTVDCDCKSAVNGSSSPICGIYATREVQLDTSWWVRVDVSDVPGTTKATGISAKSIILADNGGSMEIAFPVASGMSKGGCTVLPQYNAERYIMNTRKVNVNGEETGAACCEVYPGWQVDMSYQDCPDGLTISVGSNWRKVDHMEYQDVMSGVLPEDFEKLYTANGIDWMVYSESRDYSSSTETRGGTWLVPTDGDFEFTVSAADGYYLDPASLHVYLDGEELECLGTSDGIHYCFEFCMPERDVSLSLSGGQLIPDPFLTDPVPASQTVLIGSSPRLTWAMNGYVVNIMRVQSSGSDDRNGKVHLEEYNDELCCWELQDTGWNVAGNMVGTFKESRRALDGDVRKYRLAVFIQGKEYNSSEFSIAWTKESSEVSRARVSSVTVLVEGGDYTGSYGDSYVELNAGTPCLAVNYYTGDFVALRQANYDAGKNSGYFLAAKFNPLLGSITFYGDELHATLSGKEKTVNISNRILAVGTLESAPGDLTVNIQGDLSIYSPRDDLGWYDGVHYFDAYGAIYNNYGNIEITGSSASDVHKLSIHYDLQEQGYGTNWYGARYYGKYAGIYASGDITVSCCSVDISGETYPNNGSFTRDSGGGYLATADRYGLWAEGCINLDNAASLNVDFPEKGTYSTRTPQGNAVGLKSGKSIRLGESSTCSISVYNNPVPYRGAVMPGGYLVDPDSEPYAVYAENMVTVAGNAALTVDAQGESVYGVYAKNGAEINTESPVHISVDHQGEPCYAFLVVNGNVRLVNCPELLLSYTEESGLDTGYEETSRPGSGGEVGRYERYARFEYTPESITSDAKKFLSYYNDFSDTGDSSTKCYCPGIGYKVTLTGDSAEDSVISVTPAGCAVSFDFCGEDGAVCRAGDKVRITVPEERLPGCGITCWTSDKLDCSAFRYYDEIDFVMGSGSCSLEPVYEYSDIIREQPAFVRNSDGVTGYIQWWCEVENNCSLQFAYLQYKVKDPITGSRWETCYDFSLFSEDDEWSGEPEFEMTTSGTCSAANGKKHINSGVSPDLPGRDLSQLNAVEYRIQFSIYAGNGIWANVCTDPFEINWNKMYIEYTEPSEWYIANANIPAGAVGTVAEINFSQFIHGGSGNFDYYAYMRASNNTDYSFSIDSDNGVLRVLRDTVRPATGKNSSGRRWNYICVTDKTTGDFDYIYFDVGAFTSAGSTVFYDTYVDGIQVSSANRNDVLGDGTVSYTPATGDKPPVLTLNNANLSRAAVAYMDSNLNADFICAPILANEDLMIRVLGDNTVDMPYDNCLTALQYDYSMREYAYVGCIAAGHVTLYMTGTGTLNLRGCQGFYTEGGVRLQGCTMDIRTDYGAYINEDLIYESGTCYSYCLDEDSIFGTGLPFSYGLVIAPSANPYEFWIMDMNEDGNIVSYAPASLKDYSNFSANRDYYVPKAAMITDKGLTATVTDGKVTCATAGLRGGDARLVVAQYLDGLMIAMDMAEDTIDLSKPHTLSFSFTPTEGAVYKAFLLYANGGMKPISSAWSSAK